MTDIIIPQWLLDQGFSPTLAQRFWSKVNKDCPIPQHCPRLGPCWLWTSCCMKNGYGVIGKGREGKGMALAHRVAWMLHFGPIPEGMYICHRCDVKLCVRMDHLFLGTPADNSKDMISKGRNVREMG